MAPTQWALSISSSKLNCCYLLLVRRYHNHHHQIAFFPVTLKHSREYQIINKNILVVCVSKRKLENHLYWLQFTSFPKSEDRKKFTLLSNQYNNLYHKANAETNHRAQMQLIPNTVVGQGRVYLSFHVDTENKILCHVPGMSAVIFLSFVKLPV